MNKLYLILVLGLSLLLFGCTQPTTGGEQTVTKYVCADGKTTVTDITTCPAVPGGTVKELTQEEKDLEVCSGMPELATGSLEDFCIMGIAGKYKNASICEEVARDQRTNCYTVVAEVKEDSGVCEEAGSEADRCYEQYATNNRDGSVCNKITNVSNKDNCYNNLANQLEDAELCDEIKSIGTKDSCYFNMATRFRDASYCNKITSADQKQNCTQQVQNMSGGGMPIKP